MSKIVQTLIILILLGVLTLTIYQSCSEKQIVISPDFENQIEQINDKIESIIVMQDSIIKQRIIHQTYITNENNTIDSLISIDSLWVNAILRAGNKRLIELPGFFQIGTNSGGIISANKNSTGW